MRRIVIRGDFDPAGGPTNDVYGEGDVDDAFEIHSTVDLEGDAYEQIEQQIRSGQDKGSVTTTVKGIDFRYHWHFEDSAP